MSNRCYLYSTDTLPTQGAADPAASLTGISEWDDDIPLVYKILLSADPMACRSSISNDDANIAIAGDYLAGLERLKAFMNRLTVPAAQPLFDATLEFFDNPRNVRKYLVLEAAEIFDYNSEPHEEQNEELLQEIKNLDEEIETALAEVLPSPVAVPEQRGLFGRLFGAKNVQTAATMDADAEEIEALGFGNWSGTLYYDLKGD
jgi:hypothetical protein